MKSQVDGVSSQFSGNTHFESLVFPKVTFLAQRAGCIIIMTKKLYQGIK
jgi:hypothetical protein